MSTVLGWDIGGVNTKVAGVAGGTVVAVRSVPFELQHDPGGGLVAVLRQLAADTSAVEPDLHAVTMTAELSQMFRTKREGVHFVLEAVQTAFPNAAILVYGTDGRFLSVADALEQPLLVAAANWAATARVVAQSVADGLLIDIGTTSTDIIPIVGGEVAALGWTDPDRLASGELVYSGAVRTPVEALAAFVPLSGGEIGVSAEGFALSGDVHLWRGDLEPEDYTAPTPDRRPATREFAGERLARAVCADREMLDEWTITTLADGFAAAQVERIADAIARVRARHPSLRTAIVTGLGAFIAARAARRAGLEEMALGDDVGRCAPAASVALLACGDRRAEALASASSADPCRLKPALYAHGLNVVKIFGGFFSHVGSLDRVLSTIADVAENDSLLIVPGGGPFADAVRDQDKREGLSDDAAHWMAVLAMDQYAHLIVSRLRGAVLVTDPPGALMAIGAGQIPVLAPYAWLRRVDPLPHSWQVTSDSIAAWVANAMGDRRLVLVKPPGATGAAIVDDYFDRVRADLSVEVIPADAVEQLRRPTRSSTA
jgi:probable H4MPT-linked C1 transfer pathway protein